MKSTELRIGNILNYEQTNHVVTSIDSLDNLIGSWWLKNYKPNIEMGIKDAGGVKVPNPYLANISDYKPIPLTEEWLLKFGFNNRLLKRILNTDLYLQGDSNEALKEYGVYLSTDIGEGRTTDPTTHLEGYFYVHQLQNLYFALTGEELTIKE